ncbi:imidazole glycerol phosphate synthase subunit HisH [Flavobacterium psychrophilum]|uniref:imidazole glycerol phosphate synthase subunit HisH n=1 Tax=Flavobacterium psychrophilum TaxID=96345 RepID=UPI000B7C4C21|nr:imidazole glycerol phosphate synthase subunit HisH [Flavobacterium psychrophilum]EKT3956158.1 imidazole glycerol phosphate synthase subunit HisH [Flavobacterium psychrophilum]EKT4510220.1 imidazole glycerol phosphate synthase subunit HisH [Flavobacterium psychrophilum]SNA77236.1 Imidazole glycerol phosphate synthase subunit HisH2 [Flavobacterium psychrophilum]SNB10241.1 Imidazole glycerol phosphate synthase subunit HisH [Flavobacterium psychrophilum]
MITIIDYGVGNVFAFQNVYKRLNIPTKIAKTINDLQDAEKLILPGVGAFDYAMEQLNNSGMREKLDELVLVEKTPVIGICVGMQMMGNNSEEGKLEGLKWIDANIKKFDETTIHQRTKLPHMGWNDVVSRNNHPLFAGLDKDAVFYFLHSFYFECLNAEDSIATSDYGINFTSAAHHNNVYGIQFHPEKSHNYGEQLLHNFSKL